MHFVAGHFEDDKLASKKRHFTIALLSFWQELHNGSLFRLLFANSYAGKKMSFFLVMWNVAQKGFVAGHFEDDMASKKRHITIALLSFGQKKFPILLAFLMQGKKWVFSSVDFLRTDEKKVYKSWEKSGWKFFFVH
jgi:hypothetical protein